MFLDELPTELLRLVVRRLSPRERLPLRRTCGMFQSLVETEGLLPFNPARIYIDFWRQIIAVFMHPGESDDYIALRNRSVQNGERLPMRKAKCPKVFTRVVRDVKTMSAIHDRFYDVGDDWTKYVNDYLRRLNKHFNPGSYNRITIILGKEIPPQLMKLSIRVNVVDIQAAHRMWNKRPLPDSLVSWTGAVTNGSRSFITVCFAPLSPNQLKILARIPSLFVFGFLDDEGAMCLLEMLANQSFPHMECWCFKLTRNPVQFLSALVSWRIRARFFVAPVCLHDRRVYRKPVTTWNQPDEKVSEEESIAVLMDYAYMSPIISTCTL